MAAVCAECCKITGKRGGFADRTVIVAAAGDCRRVIHLAPGCFLPRATYRRFSRSLLPEAARRFPLPSAINFDIVPWRQSRLAIDVNPTGSVPRAAFVNAERSGEERRGAERIGETATREFSRGPFLATRHAAFYEPLWSGMRVFPWFTTAFPSRPKSGAQGRTFGRTAPLVRGVSRYL